MVQKKAPDKQAAPGESKKNHARSEKRLYSRQRHHQQQDVRGGGGAELRRMLKKSRSIKVLEESLDSPLVVQLDQPGVRKPKKNRPSPVLLPGTEPNYMKSTSSSNARKEQHAVNRNRIPKDTTKPLKPSPGHASAVKQWGTLERKPSLRPAVIRPSRKKSLGMPLCHVINASRATCSSTMKETNFPYHLDLDPGGTEAEGTSVLKVCPYTYCSLNGHRHPCLPPLRCFLSARRRLLKTQKNMMKLRGLASFRNRGMEAGTGGEELPAGVSDLGDDDFFVEICAAQFPEPNSATASGEGVDGMSPTGDGVDDRHAQIEQDVGSPVDHSMSQSTSDDDHFDLGSDFSPSEMEVLIDFLEYVECDAAEDTPCSAEEDADWSCGDSGEGLADDLDCGLDDGSHIDFDEIQYSEFAEGESTDGLFVEIYVDGCDEAPFDANSALPYQGREEEVEKIVAEPAGEGGNCKSVDADPDEEYVWEDEGGGTASDASEGNSEVEESGMFDEQEAAAAVGEETQDLVAVSNPEDNMNPLFGDDIDEKNRDAHDESSGKITASQSSSLVRAVDGDTAEHLEAAKTEMQQQITTPDEAEDLSDINNFLLDVNPHTVNQEEKGGKIEKDLDEASSTEMETLESSEEHESQVFVEMPSEADDESGTATSDEYPQHDEALVGAITSMVEEHTDASHSSRARRMVTRKRADGGEEQMRPFNPRSPNFLPVEPDPEGEKVDLRHQVVDERKNAEEWMIDHALRQTVDKLAPGRKRKVALLVEAFETVTPMPSYGATLGHSTMAFAHARPIQACS
uniref:Calmodulin-binding domain-containing protein n=1 Tax=Anthurium amnicola TaxID=1678845 RepID=A0A1D1YVF5_9ARAE